MASWESACKWRRKVSVLLGRGRVLDDVIGRHCCLTYAAEEVLHLVHAIPCGKAYKRTPLAASDIMIASVTRSHRLTLLSKGSGPKSKFVYIRRAAYSKSATKMSDELFINKPVPGADQYYPLNDPPIGTALPEVCAGIFEISARGIE